MDGKATSEHEAGVRRDDAAPNLGPDRLANYQLLRLALHEMRTPLTSVQLNAQLIERSLAKLGLDKECRLAGTIVSAARKLDGLTQELGEAARLLSGKISLDLRVHDLARVVPEILSRHVAAPDSNRIRLEIPPGPLPITADERCLDRILTNLVQIGLGLDAGENGIDLRVSTAEVEVVVEISVPTPAPPVGIGVKRPQVDHPLPSGEGRGEGTALHVESCRRRSHSTLVTSTSGSVEAPPSPPSPSPGGRGVPRFEDSYPRITTGHLDTRLTRLMPAPPVGGPLALPSDEELGLGFCLARVLVELHGGKLEAQSGPAHEVVLCFSLTSPGRA
jgi:hypothetical protein